MKTPTAIFLVRLAVGILLCLNSAKAATHYVNASGTSPVSPYTSWATAATNIQDAILPAAPFDTILVTNGTYRNGGLNVSGSNRVHTIFGHLTIQSVNGPAVTIIEGHKANGPSAVRCVNLTDGGILSGFTLTNGATPVSANGGGVQASVDSVVTNCIITGNSAYSSGGGVYGGRVINCIIAGNTAVPAPSLGIGGGAAQSTLVNCLLTGNQANYRGGAAQTCVLINCTVSGNTGQPDSLDGCKIRNSICYYNTPDNGEASGDANTFSNCCLAVFPFSGANILTNPPAFVDPVAANYHISMLSPCIDAGINGFNTNSTDLDGNPRIIAAAIDLGAYEFPSLIRYVNVSNTAPVSPFTNWLAAATNIQDAINVAGAGDFIVVSNGIYKTGGGIVYGASSNRVVINRPVTVTSVNGPGVTGIQGFQGAAAPYGTRCVYLTNGAALAGFSLTVGGSAGTGDTILEESGGGVWCESSSALVSNCVISGNFARRYGGGAFRGTLVNCILTNNSAPAGGGGCSNVLTGCTVVRNVADSSVGFGGGIFQGILNNCVISNNQAFASGGGAYNAVLNNSLVINNRLIQGSGGGGTALGALNNCWIVGNFAPGFGGGAYSNVLNNCIVSNNTAGFGGGVAFGVANNSLISSNMARLSGPGGGAYSDILSNCVLQNNFALNGGGAYHCALINCTVVSNTVPGDGGGINGGGATNCIVYYNVSPGGANFSVAAMSWCDTTPLPAGGFGNITNEPLFLNVSSEDFHLQSNSPCINSGNNTVVIGATDFDGLPRIAGGTVDLGAYEFQLPSSLLSYAYLQLYGLPTDGSADNADTDGDGASNYAEWRAGTNPTNAASVLQMTCAAPTNSAFVTITWQSVNGELYLIQRGADLSVPLTTVQSNIVGQAGSTSYTDTNDNNGDHYFYRVGVQ